MTHNLLFVYGTLLLNGNEFGNYLHHNSTFFAEGKFNGRLYNIGRYPGAVYNEQETGFVYGSIYSITDCDTVLEKLDDYEGVGEEYRQPNEYIRKLLPVAIDTGQVICWIYIYNRDEKGLERITSGRYISS